MLKKIKDVVLDTAYRCGLDLKRSSHSPFGMAWHRDLQYFLNGSSAGVIFDIGANLGQTALSAIRQFPESRIFSFEPVDSTYQKLVANTARYSQVEAVHCAMGDAKGRAKMTTAPLSVSNTMVLGNDAPAKAGEYVEVPVDTVDSFCHERNIPGITLLKIDTEGYEMNVLRGAQTMLTGRHIDFILVECDFFRRKDEPHGDFVEIHNCLLSFEFHVVSFYTGGVDNLGWVWGDALFRRTSGLERGRVVTSPARR